MEICKCLNCGRKFISVKNKKFCSANCIRIFSSKLTFQKKCKHCNNYFESEDRNSEYCSKKCKHQQHINHISLPKPQIKKCLWCGKILTRHELARDPHWNNLKYCSKRCQYNYLYSIGRWPWGGSKKPPEEHELQPKPCKTCGKIMKLPENASRHKKAVFGKRPFCSKHCYDQKYHATNKEKRNMQNRVGYFRRKAAKNAIKVGLSTPTTQNIGLPA